MEQQCPACTTSRTHTAAFDKLYAAILGELKERNIPGVDDPEELAMSLSVLAADALSIDIYQTK